jgi:hypothetical protein
MTQAGRLITLAGGSGRSKISPPFRSYFLPNLNTSALVPHMRASVRNP